MKRFAKPSYAIAMEMRKDDKDLDAKFMALPNIKQWEWLAYACEHQPIQALAFAHELVGNFSPPIRV